jgi:hypothetical protein
MKKVFFPRLKKESSSEVRDNDFRLENGKNVKDKSQQTLQK